MRSSCRHRNPVRHVSPLPLWTSSQSRNFLAFRRNSADLRNLSEGGIIVFCYSLQKVHMAPGKHWALPGEGIGTLLRVGGELGGTPLTSLGCSCGTPWEALGHFLGKPLENTRISEVSQAPPPPTRPCATERRARQAPQTDRPRCWAQIPLGILKST